MKIKLLAIIVLVMVALLSVAGCTFPITSSSPTPSPTPTSTPTPPPTPTPVADYRSYYTTSWEGSGMIVTQAFTKSTNVRGNDVYMGIIKNATLAGAIASTTVIELAKSQAQAKQVYNSYVTAKQNEGFTLRSDWVAQLQAGVNLRATELWSGQNGAAQFTAYYRYNPDVQSWEVTTEVTA